MDSIALGIQIFFLVLSQLDPAFYKPVFGDSMVYQLFYVWIKEIYVFRETKADGDKEGLKSENK